MKRTCIVPNCGLPHHSNGYCTGHRQRVAKTGSPGDSMLIRGPGALSLLNIQKPHGDSGCWYWRQGRVGYTQIKVNGSSLQAHRFVYEELVGTIPPDSDLDHLCHTADLSCGGGRDCPHRACVNPSHLEPVSHAENVRRGRGLAAKNASKTHCIRGHEFSPENTRYRMKNGRPYRACIACQQERNQERANALRGIT